MSWEVPTVQAFKDQFFRDFNYAPANSPNDLKFITDRDITKAYGQARLNFNPGLFGTNDDTTLVFLWLAAFYLVYDLQTSAQGIGSQANFPVTSRSVGNVSASFQIPDKIMKNPNYAIYAQNGYGMKYLSLVIPFTIGNVGIVCGTTTVA